MRRRTVLAAGLGLAVPGGPWPGARRAAAGQGADAVDLLLVLAADVSRSMSDEDLRLQRDGYVAALRHPAVAGAIASGPLAAIGVAYLEWSGHEHQRLLVPWTRLEGPEAAADFAARLAAAPTLVGTWTSISGAIAASRALIAGAPFAAERRVIDVSGDGVNNNGPPAGPERDLAVEAGITVNGLPILRGAGRPQTGWTPAEVLEEHYRDEVTGGPGAFVMPAEGLESFGAAVRRKLIREIASAPGAPGPG